METRPGTIVISRVDSNRKPSHMKINVRLDDGESMQLELTPEQWMRVSSATVTECDIAIARRAPDPVTADLVEALEDLVSLSESMMNEYGERDIDAELKDARAALAKAAQREG